MPLNYIILKKITCLFTLAAVGSFPTTGAATFSCYLVVFTMDAGTSMFTSFSIGPISTFWILIENEILPIVYNIVNIANNILVSPKIY